MIDLDITFFIQFVNFVVTLMVLNVLLVRPIRMIIKRRNEHMDDMLTGAEQFTSSAEEKMLNYSAALDEARKSGVEERNKLKDEAVEESKTIFKEAGDEVTEKLTAARKEIENEAAAAKNTLMGQVDKMAGQIAAKFI